MAKTHGPGPGAYLLPTTVGYHAHDPSRLRNPMYSMGARSGYTPRGLGPGPAYRIERMTRSGPEYTPAWSFGARLGGRGAARTPGPGAHAPERCPLFREARPPAYSMGARLGYKGGQGGPAPNAYAVRAVPGLPSPPAWSMAGRPPLSGKQASPGPAAYFQKDQNVYKQRTPEFSLGARLPGAGRGAKSPGPATYPPNLYNTKKTAHAFSFGIHHSPYSPPLITREDTMDCL